MNGVEIKTERIFRCIWDHLITYDELPSTKVVAQTLKLSHREVIHHVNVLWSMGRTCRTSPLPIGYGRWWRKDVRREQRRNLRQCRQHS